MVSRPVKHGARSKVLKLTGIAIQERSLLRKIGTSKSQLDWTSRSLLEAAARARWKLRAYDGWIEEHGRINGNGDPWGFAPDYGAAERTYIKAIETLAVAVAKIGKADAQGALLADLAKYRGGSAS